MLWNYYGQKRPPFAAEVLAGQESVWDYPRPPKLVPDTRHISVVFDGLRVADSDSAWRLLETASAPGVYLPSRHVDMELLQSSAQRTFCEWKGEAVYFDLSSPRGVLRNVAWSYPNPSRAFANIAGCISFYPGRIECYIEDERVRPQPGGFYGGWITSDIAGPVKGAPGTGSW